MNQPKEIVEDKKRPVNITGVKRPTEIVTRGKRRLGNIAGVKNPWILSQEKITLRNRYGSKTDHGKQCEEVVLNRTSGI